MNISLKLLIENAYILFICISLFFHVLNYVEIGAGIKAFQLFSVVAAILSMIVSRHDKSHLKIYLSVILFFTLLSSALSLYEDSLKDAFALIILTIGTYSLKNIKPSKIFLALNFFLPVVLLLLLVHAIIEPTFRYQGFYNDPNYLCTTLLVFTYILFCSIKIFSNRFALIFLFFELILVIFLASLTLSRTGIFCITLLFLVQIISNFKKYPLRFMFLICLSISICFYFFSDFINQQAMLLHERTFEKNDNMTSAGELRGAVSMQGVKHVLSNPIDLVFGIGIGASGHQESITKRVSYHRDHNTITSCFTEQGFFSFLFFFIFQYKIFRSLLEVTANNKIFKFSVFISLLIFSLSIWQMVYLPYWFLLFLLINNCSE